MYSKQGEFSNKIWASKVLKADRKDSRNSKPGLIIAKLNSVDDETLAMKAKSKLKGNKSFGNIYTEKDIP
jgi:hypothetical protein